MIRLLLFLVALGLLGLAAAWTADHPGEVVMYWLGYRIETSVAFLSCSALAAAFTLSYLCLLLVKIIRFPQGWRSRRQLKHYELGLSELTYGVAALAAADVQSAQLHTRKAEKLLGRTPLTLLLGAQVARVLGDDDKTRLLLEQMLKHKETEYLAARSLSEAAGKQHLFPQALALAERAHNISPKGTGALVSLQLRLGQWQKAHAAIRKAARRGALTREELRRYTGLAYLQEGEQLLVVGGREGALYAARKTLRELPHFAPAAIFAAKAYAGGGHHRKAIKALLVAWRHAPHPQIIHALHVVLQPLPTGKRQSWLNHFYTFHPEPPLPDTPWRCTACGHNATAWDVHCPACDAFDTLG